MLKRRLISMALSVAMILGTLAGMTAVSAAPASDGTAEAAAGEIVVDFTTMSSVPVYSAAAKQGFVSESGAIRAPGKERKVAKTSQISISSAGASVTESNGEYLYEQTNKDDGGDYNRGGLIYRIDTGAPGAYHIEVEVLDASNTTVAPTGMEAGRLTGTNTWDNAGLVKRTVSAVWAENKWSYDFATGEDFVEIEIEPSKAPTAAAPQTVGVKSIKLTPLAVNVAGDKPTIHILGDSTQKTYTFNETISSWGQTLYNYFDLSKVNVINYSMGGRAMKSNYNEGRFDEILIRGKQGDYVFLHSAHNDETVSKNRFSRGSGIEKTDLATNNTSYNTWLDMYMKAIKARGMTPVLVTAMPRTGSGKYSEGSSKPNGFNPDSPGNMRAKAKSDSEIGLVELYAGAKKYIDSLDAAEVEYIYNSVEAGETPANNSANGAKGDGTHYREAAAKQFCRIILQSIYDQANASTDTYTDKPIMQKLVSYMPQTVQDAAKSGDWSAVFPEMAKDVSAAGVVPGATKQAKNNYYYRTSIEKALQLGALHKNSANEFKPTQTITVGEFARGMETVFGLPENSLTNYTRTYEEMHGGAASASAASYEDAADITYAASEAAQAEAAAGEITVTVQQPTGGSVKIYNESQHNAKTTDIKSGVEANQVLDDNEYYKLTAPAKITNNKSDSSGKFPTNSAISTNYFEFRKADDTNGDKEVYYDAKASGTLTLYMMFDNTKAITLENITDGTKVDAYIEGEKADAANRNKAVYNTVSFNVEAGKSYKTYCNGGTGRLFGVMYEAEYPQSDSSLSVSTGDKIKVVAGADNGYVFDSITVNGEKKSSKREYTFEVSGSTTVSAVFTKEPEVVENAAVASDAALTREVMGAIMYDAYNKVDKTNISRYIAQNGGVLSPDDPNYDPNLTYEGTPYIPLAGWGALTDTDALNTDLYAKVKAAYNLGLIRSEQGIKRGAVACGNKLEPTVEVTRAKAAKALVFCYTLTQPLNGESQVIPGGVNHAAETAEIAVPNPKAPKTPYVDLTNYVYEITKAEYDAGGSLAVELSYSGEEASPKAKLIAAAYSENDTKVLLDTAVYDVEGTTIKDFVYNKPENSVVKLYVWDGLDTMVPLSAAKTATLSTNPSTSAEPVQSADPIESANPNPSQSPSYEKKATVVTASGKTFDFTSIRDAVAKAVELAPKSEAERITINVNPGDYEEQVIFPDGAKFITLQQTPDTLGGGRVNLHWYYCTGYCAGTADLNGNYDPTLNWSDPRTWKGYNDVNEKGEVIANNEEDFTEYRVGQVLSSGTKISYYTSDGKVHKDVSCTTGHLGGNRSLDQIAALITKKGATDITVKDFNIVNSIPVMVTAGEKAAGVAPEEDRNADHATSYVLPRRDNLVICSEDTVEKTSSAIDAAFKISDDVKKVKALEALTNLTPENSKYLALSSKYNERGHAVSTNGDRIYFENIRLRGNQDSLYASNGRNYFKNCDIIGGTDYIYGSATCVFDNCKLGLEGFSDKSYGSPIAVPSTPIDRAYGYLFWNCTMYNMRDNNGENSFGGSWNSNGQSTYYNSKLDDNKSIGKSKFVICEAGWDRFNAAEGLHRLYEYNTTNLSGAPVNTSERVVNKSIEEGGPGMGTVIDEWQVLEFNPRNYFAAANGGSATFGWTDDWDPMNFGETYLKEVDAAIAGAAVTVPEGDATEVALPAAPSGIEFKWESASSNAVVTSDGKLQVIRPAAGEEAIDTTVTLYARDSKTGYGDKKDVNVTINPTTDTTNIFNIPVTITQSAAGANDYTVTLTKNGALIKQQVISIADGQNTITETIANIPVGTYDVKVVSKSDEFSITVPDMGETTIEGAKGEEKALAVTASKLVDATVSLDINYASTTDHNKVYDIMELAKAKGVDVSFDNSDSYKISYTLNVNKVNTSGGSFIDLVSGTPSADVKNGELNSRYVLAKLGHWNQLDMVDCTQGYSGSSDGDGQALNMSGKFAVGTPNEISVTIDYKNSVVSAEGHGAASKTKTFANFPISFQRGDVKMAIYAGTEDFTITDVKVTYKKLVTGE